MVNKINLSLAWKVASSVPDPELPFLTLADLGILRGVTIEDNTVVAKLTPTYTGCPAVSVIENDVLTALTNAGFNARIERSISPAWTTDWISERGRKKLKDNGIAPPNAVTVSKKIKFPLFEERVVQCPRCNSSNTEKLSEFGSTPCKAQYRCCDCLEPFDHFKCH